MVPKGKMIKIYDLVPDDRHVIVNVCGKKCLIDTGSPFILGLDGTSVEFAGKTFLANDKSPIQKWSFSEIKASGMIDDVDFILGTKALFGTPFTIDKKAGTFVVAPVSGEKVGSASLGVPTCDGYVDGKPACFLVDTGAPVTFVPAGIDWVGAVPQESFRDFYPLQGWFDSPARKLSVAVLDNRFEDMYCADTPSTINGGGLTFGTAICILGMRDVLEKGRLGFDLKKGLVGYERF